MPGVPGGAGRATGGAFTGLPGWCHGPGGGCGKSTSGGGNGPLEGHGAGPSSASSPWPVGMPMAPLWSCHVQNAHPVFPERLLLPPAWRATLALILQLLGEIHTQLRTVEAAMEELLRGP